jgi:iron complex outermembrane recepter protein
MRRNVHQSKSREIQLNQRIFRLLTCVSLGALALGSADRALAAPATDPAADTTAAQGQVTEVVVTAQRRTQRLQDVGIAVTAVTSAQMRQLGVASSKDISKVAPGVLLDSTAGGGVNANLTIRGVSQSDFSSIQESPNSIYIDDVYLSSPNSAAFSLYDLDRIEVLRGPQGTLFGRASSGGLANFIVAKPTKDFTGYVEAGYSSYNDAYVEAAASGPITDNVRFRISGRRETSDGWFQNGAPGGGASFAKDFYGIRAQLEADVTPDLTARFSLSYDADPTHAEGAYRSAPAYIVNGQPELLPANVDAYGTGPGNDMTGYRNPYSQYNKSAFNSNVGHLQNERFSPTLYLTQKLGPDATLTSITNYTKFGFNYSEDCDGGPVNFCTDQLAQSLEQWSQELRLNGRHGPLTYTAGFYYLNTRQSTPQGFDFPALSGTPYGFYDVNNVHQSVSSWSLFGQAEYQFTDTLSATLGARYTDEHKDFSSQVYFNELGSFYGGPGVSVPPLLVYDFSKAAVGDLASHDEGLWSGKAELDYKPIHDMLFYVSVSRGVKAAGYNTNLGGSLSIAQTPFKSEYVYAYEVGSKLDLLDHHVRWNTSVFYYDDHRFQGYAFIGTQGVVGNYNGYFTGGETELIVAPRRDIDLSISASNLLTKLYDVPTAYFGVRDEQSIMAPRWTLQLSATKRFELPIGTLAFNWNGNYIDARYASIDNNNATYVPGSFVNNARLSLDMKDKGLEFAFFVDNISNVAREQFQYDLTTTTGSWIRAYAPPRWIGGSIRKSF